MSTNKNRIGFVLASIYTGSAQNMWSTLIRETSHSDSAFYIFPGGALNAEKNSEYVRNSIYNLINSENLDGLISWGSSIGGSVSTEELNRFHRGFGSLPYVTIAHKMQDAPCVSFDAYNGMADLVRHFLDVHHATKIAFLRGPENHASSMERYQAFCDVMKQKGFDMEKSPLISDPFAWTEGEAAAKQLYHERKLVPGQDFEVLIGSSDLMILGAVRYLAKAGFTVPDDYTCAGFNDSPEGRIIGCTTVHMPFVDLGLTAFSMMRSALVDHTKNTRSVTLPAPLVIRESCGCLNSDNPQFFEDAIPTTPIQVVDVLSVMFRLDSTSTNAMIEPLVGALSQHDEKLLFTLLEKILERFFEYNDDIRMLFSAYAMLRAVPCFDSSWIEGLESRFYRLVLRIQDQVTQNESFRTRIIAEKLNSLKCGLLTARDRKSLCDILAKHLPMLSINTAALVLTDNDTNSTFIGGFSENKRYDEQKNFPSSLLLPKGLTGFDTGVFLVQPLFTEKQPLGYFVCSVPPQHNGTLFEDLRSAISSALAGIFMFEENSAAKQKAEQAEQAKNSFFANVGTDLSEPLIDVTQKLNQMQNILASVSRENDILSSQMIFLRNQISEQVEKTNLVIDLTRLQSNEFVFKTRLFHITSITDREQLASDYPLLYGDPDRIAQSLKIVCDEWKIPLSDIQLHITPQGLEMILENPMITVPLNVWEQNTLQVVQYIFMRSGASIKKTPHGCQIVYPWPTFDCANAVADVDHISWNADEAAPEAWISMYAKREDSSFMESAFLCYTALPEEELEFVKTFVGLFEHRMSSTVFKNVFFIGFFSKYPSWISHNHICRLNSIDEFDETVRVTAPSLVVLDSLDYEGVKKIRGNPITAFCPIFVLPEHITDLAAAEKLLLLPRVILCHRCVAFTEEFGARARSILVGGEILPPDTGALVKRAVIYFGAQYKTQILRWKLADYVHVSEDYLTRIFHKELGLSPWKYLNQYRIFRACELLLQTNDTISEIAEKTGFQDSAYFSRVFRKITGVTTLKYKRLTIDSQS
ncbi:MAG: helix-turn-helix domain-containing protein [Treponema sp.]|nr:helix-turn-helix domain-containing protein [Treponema sp.]